MKIEELEVGESVKFSAFSVDCVGKIVAWFYHGPDVFVQVAIEGARDLYILRELLTLWVPIDPCTHERIEMIFGAFCKHCNKDM